MDLVARISDSAILNRSVDFAQLDVCMVLVGMVCMIPVLTYPGYGFYKLMRKQGERERKRSEKRLKKQERLEKKKAK